jgi:hypothetical protein
MRRASATSRQSKVVPHSHSAFCSTDTSRSRSARLWLHLVHRASPNKGGSSILDTGACSLRPLVCPSLSCNSHAPYRSADYNRVRNRKTNRKFPQETVSDVVFPEWGSLKDRGKDTMDGCRAAFSNSSRVMSLACTPKQNRLILQGAGVNNAGHGRMRVRHLDDTRVTQG